MPVTTLTARSKPESKPLEQNSDRNQIRQKEQSQRRPHLFLLGRILDFADQSFICWRVLLVLGKKFGLRHQPGSVIGWAIKRKLVFSSPAKDRKSQTKQG